MRFLILAMGVAVLTFASQVQAGDFRGQARALNSDPVGNLTVTAIRADGRVVFSRFFANGNFVVPINNAALFADNQSLTLIFSSPGRDDARLDNLLGSATSTLDVILPQKFQVVQPPQPCYPCQPHFRCRRRCW